MLFFPWHWALDQKICANRLDGSILIRLDTWLWNGWIVGKKWLYMSQSTQHSNQTYLNIYCNMQLFTTNTIPLPHPPQNEHSQILFWIASCPRFGTKHVLTVLLSSSVLIYTKLNLKCITKCWRDKKNNSNRTMYAITRKPLCIYPQFAWALGQW